MTFSAHPRCDAATRAAFLIPVTLPANSTSGTLGVNGFNGEMTTSGMKAQKDPKMTVHTYVGSGALGLRLQDQGRAGRRCARAPGAGDRPQKDVAGHHQWPEPAGAQSLRRRHLGEVQGRRRLTRRYREPKALTRTTIAPDQWRAINRISDAGQNFITLRTTNTDASLSRMPGFGPAGSVAPPPGRKMYW
jgi:hypothetical protein